MLSCLSRSPLPSPGTAAAPTLRRPCGARVTGRESGGGATGSASRCHGRSDRAAGARARALGARRVPGGRAARRPGPRRARERRGGRGEDRASASLLGGARPIGPGALGWMRSAVHSESARPAVCDRRGRGRRTRGGRASVGCCRTRSWRRSRESCRHALRRCWCSRTCTGRTRPRSTCCRLLARRVETVPALIVASYRDDELARSQPLRIVVGELATNQAVARLRLAPLSPAAVAQLAEPHGVDSDELYRKTAGNPFFVVEALATQGDEVPDTVRDAVFARTARLSDSAKQLLESVSVVQGPAELWLLEALAGEAIDGLDECVTSGMLTHVPAGVAFRHELARLAVEESVALNRRVELHRQSPRSARGPARRRARSGPARLSRRGGRRRRRGRSLRTGGRGRRGVARRAPRGGRTVRAGASIRRPASRRRARGASGGPLARVLLHRSVRRRHRGARTGARDPPSAGRQARGRRRAPSALRVPLVPGPDGGIRRMRPRCGLAARSACRPAASSPGRTPTSRSTA